MIIVDNVQQGDPEWHLTHGSVPTASCFNKIITTKGGPSSQQSDYRHQIAGTQVFKVYEDSYASWHMQRGIELEDDAKSLYKVITGNDLVDVGFCYYDERHDRGCSPDALINDDGVLEIKSPMLKTHVKYILGGKLPSEYYQQVQGGLYVTGRKYAHFMSYFPSAPAFIFRVERDEGFIQKLDEAINEFNIKLSILVRKLKESQ